jgi:hypothetical protein
MNKKASMIGSQLVIAILIIISFIVVVSFFLNASQIIVSESDDKICRTYVSVISTSLNKITLQEFTKNLGIKCKKDVIKSSANGKDEVFQEMAETMKRCWYRYGEGEYDFMSNFDSQGDFCFTCAKITFDNDDSIYDYGRSDDSFIEWIQKPENSFKLENEKVTYYDYLNLKYPVVDDSDENVYLEVNRLLLELSNEVDEGSDKSTQELLFILSNENEKYFDMVSKNLDLGNNKDYYVVYRYDGLPADFWDIVISMGAGLGATLVAETLVSNLAIMATFTIAGGPIGAVAGSIVVVVKTGTQAAVNAGKMVVRGEKIARIGTYFKNGIKFTKASSKLDDIITKFSGSTDDLVNVANMIEKTDPASAAKFRNYAKKLSDNGLDGIDTTKRLDDLTPDEYQKLFDESMDIFKDSKLLLDDVAQNPNLVRNEDDLRALISEGDEIASLIDSRELTDAYKVPEFAKKVILYTAPAAAATTIADYSSNNVQYVDFLTKEQYYRLCGTETSGFARTGLFS